MKMKDNTMFKIDTPAEELEVKYGLPRDVIFCKKCVISNQRPSSSVEFAHNAKSKKTTISFGEDGICDACRYAEMKEREVDWDQREAHLRELLDKYRSRNGSYDILVPGSGGKDSVFASHILKHKYKMNPLTVTWAPHLYTDVGWKNFQNWLHMAGLDNFLFTPDGQVHRKLTELAYRNLLHPFQPFIIGQKNYAPKMAAQFGIPLVFYGENEAEYGNPINENINAKRKASYFAQQQAAGETMYFGGVAMEDLPEHGILPGQLDPYLPITAEALERGKVEVHYLGYYLKWTPQECYYYAVEHTGFEANTERTEGTYSKYNSIDDKTDGYHYWTTFIKFGIGRATYDAAQEVRNRHIERDEAVALVHRYDGELPQKYLPEFLEYLSMDKDEFLEIADSFRSPHLWAKDNGEWILRHKVK
ncbi:MAG: LPS biosynthesis protein PseA [Rhodospirillaceae bacterium]|jgi:N-acetyl sugar amidotransferase|nr:LPS biosynthesis protein PseA [Rhodospirillales bacterium]MAX47901.1 LPS biosynthesis protein PseA [Rhodospirillaceae bacterium]|tara:strand:- start:188198 stop:189451 length:1254 start_codon:yes stop_codon:yes gene_type:complete